MNDPDEPTIVGLPSAEPSTEDEPPPRRLSFRRESTSEELPHPETLRRDRALRLVRTTRERSAAAVVAAVPSMPRVMIALGATVLLFVLYVTVFGAMRHTARQDKLEEAFRARVAAGHADRPNWRPLPGQAIATFSIPAIDLFEVVVDDTTTELLKSGPGHLLGTPLPGQRGNVILLGRRVTDGRPFGSLDDLTKGDRITVVTPSGPFVYTVAQVVRVSRGATEAFRQTDDARLTLVTSASSFVPADRTVVVALMSGTPIDAPGPPLVQQRAPELGTTGDSAALVHVTAWALVLVFLLVAWFRERRRIHSRWYRFVIATPVVAIVLFFLFENAENLLPGSI